MESVLWYIADPAPPPRPHPAPPPSVAKYTAEKVAADMEFFTMELLKGVFGGQ